MLIFHYFSGFSSEFVKSFKYGFPSNWLSLVSDHFNSQSRLVFVICFVRGWEDTCYTGHLSLCMGIYDKVKVATIAIYEVTILEIKAIITLLFQSSLTSLVMQWQQRNPQKNALQVHCFSFAYFFPFCPWCGYAELTSSANMQKVLDVRQFCLKPSIWWKTCNEINVHWYPYRSSHLHFRAKPKQCYNPDWNPTFQLWKWRWEICSRPTC